MKYFFNRRKLHFIIVCVSLLFLLPDIIAAQQVKHFGIYAELLHTEDYDNGYKIGIYNFSKLFSKNIYSFIGFYLGVFSSEIEEGERPILPLETGSYTIKKTDRDLYYEYTIGLKFGKDLFIIPKFTGNSFLGIHGKGFGCILGIESTEINSTMFNFHIFYDIVKRKRRTGKYSERSEWKDFFGIGIGFFI
jgi:hypothetical protein